MIRSFKNVLTSALVVGLMLTAVNAEAKAKKSSKKPVSNPKKETVVVAPVEQDTILVELKGAKITKKDLDARIEKIPPMYRTRYKSVDGQKQVLDMLLQEELFYLEALAQNMPTNESVKKAIVTNSRTLYNEKYYQREIASKININNESLKKFYDENKSQYVTPASITIRHLQVKNDSLAQIVKSALDNKKDFSDLIKLYSENKYSKEKDGIITSIRHNKYITGIGKDQELDDFIYMLPVDTIKVNGPFATRQDTPDSAVHFFQKLEHKAETYKPFDEVKADVESKYRFSEEQKLYQALITDLMKKNNIVIDEKYIETTDVMKITPDQYDKILVNSSNPELVLTAKQVFELIKNKYQMERANVQDPKIRLSAVKKDIESRLLYLDAISKKYDQILANDSDLNQLKRTAYLRELYNQEVINKTVVTEQDKKDFYNKNLKAYTEQAHKDIRQFVFTNEKDALKLQKKIAKMVKKNQEDKIIPLVKKHSLYAEADGLVKSVYNNTLIPGYGNDAEYCKLVFATNPTETSKVFKNIKDEYVFFYIVKDYPEKVKPYEELTESINNNTTRVKNQERFQTLLKEYKLKYAVVEHTEAITPKVTVNELFDMAENAQKQNNYQEAVYYYDQIIKSFPNGKDDYKAWFMKAFVYAEDLKDKDQATKLYKEMLVKWPTGELNESAQFMIDTLNGEKDPNIIIKD